MLHIDYYWINIYTSFGARRVNLDIVHTSAAVHQSDFIYCNCSPWRWTAVRRERAAAWHRRRHHHHHHQHHHHQQQRQPQPPGPRPQQQRQWQQQPEGPHQQQQQQQPRRPPQQQHNGNIGNNGSNGNSNINGTGNNNIAAWPVFPKGILRWYDSINKWIASLFLPTNGIESAMVCALPTSPRNASALLGSLCHILNPSLAPLPHVSAPWLLVGQNTNELRASSWTMKLHVMKMMEWPPPFFFWGGGGGVELLP